MEPVPQEASPHPPIRVTFQDLADALPVANISGDPATPVGGITNDSREVRPGDLFACIPGFQDDGHNHIPEALARGATCLLVERAVPIAGVAVLQVPAARRAMAEVAARFYGYPSSKLRVYAVTGTNGKTTTAHLIHAVLAAVGRPAGLIGTVYNRVGGAMLPARHTTPDSPELQRLLAAMVAAGDTSAVLEASSHGLELDRLHCCEVDTAVFTNLARDHFEFHRDPEHYLAAKARLFQLLGLYPHNRKTGRKFAILNADDPAAATLADATRAEVLTYGLSPGCTVRAEGCTTGLDGTRARVSYPGGGLDLDLKLPGRFNLYNALAALTACLAEGVAPDRIAAALGTVESIPGRHERIVAGQDFTVLVDFAHNPAALEEILILARSTARRVAVVFGCEGGKDPGKRPLMGAVAARHADLAILTSDNLFHEEYRCIAATVEPGLAEGPAAYRSIPDRQEAIQTALTWARPGDVVVVAGKGHETHQIIGAERLPFDDREVVREILQSSPPPAAISRSPTRSPLISQ